MSTCSCCQRAATKRHGKTGERKTQWRAQARSDGLAGELRQTLIGQLDRVFAQAFPQLAKADRGRMLAAWSDITGAMIASLDRSKPGERGKLLEELKTILSAYLDAKLAALG